MHLVTGPESLHAISHKPAPTPTPPSCLCREQRLGSYVDMCRDFAADVQAQRGWKGSFHTSSEDGDEGEGQAAAGGSEAADGQAPTARQDAQQQ